jgi:hypothetical protein
MKTALEFVVGLPVGVWGCGTLYWMYAMVKNDRHVRQIVRSGGLDSLLCWFLAAALWPLGEPKRASPPLSDTAALLLDLVQQLRPLPKASYRRRLEIDAELVKLRRQSKS